MGIEYSDTILHLTTVAAKAQEAKWISEEQNQFFEGTLTNEALKICIVGKMSSGKSSLLNILFFADEFLPVGASPTTAILTVIRYGENNAASIQYYTNADIENLQNVVAGSGEEVSEDDRKNAKEILKNVNQVLAEHSDFGNLLGTVQKVDLYDLGDYVKKDGLYAPLVKSVELTYNQESIRGCEFIDTPGFNDPVVSRARVARDYLSCAHAVLFISNNNDFLDQVERSLWVDQIELAGVGEVIYLINKMDQLGAEATSWANVMAALNGQRRQNAVNEFLQQGKTRAAEVLKSSQLIPVSAYMASIGRTLKAKGPEGLDRAQAYWYGLISRKCTEINNAAPIADEFCRLGNMSSVLSAVNEKIRAKSDRLFTNKPKATLVGYIERALMIRQDALESEKENLQLLQADKARREQRIEELNRALAGFDSMVGSVTGSNLMRRLGERKEQLHRELIDLRERACQSISKMDEPTYGFFSSKKKRERTIRYNHQAAQDVYFLLRSEISRAIERTRIDFHKIIGDEMAELEHTVASNASNASLVGRLMKNLANDCECLFQGSLSPDDKFRFSAPDDSVFQKTTPITYYRSEIMFDYDSDQLKEYCDKFDGGIRQIPTTIKNSMIQILETERQAVQRLTESDDPKKKEEYIYASQKKIKELGQTIEEIQVVLQDLNELQMG